MSPFRSVKQRKFMWAKHPEIAREWTEKYGSDVETGKKVMKTAKSKKGKK